MDRGAALLTELQKKLGVWLDKIRRATGATTVAFEPGEENTFFVLVRWGEGGTAREVRKHFTRPYVFGSSFGAGPSAWRVQEPVCFYARAVIQTVLQERGALK